MVKAAAKYVLLEMLSQLLDAYGGAGKELRRQFLIQLLHLPQLLALLQ
jgi:hypothetical protein